jgi:hypothetical protein
MIGLRPGQETVKQAIRSSPSFHDQASAEPALDLFFVEFSGLTGLTAGVWMATNIRTFLLSRGLQ